MPRETEIFCPCGEPMHRLAPGEAHGREDGLVLQCFNPSCSGRILGSDDLVSLDLFCGVGGVCRALQRHQHVGNGCVIGVDQDDSKRDRYPGYFIEHDLTQGLPGILESFELFDVAWASPPCQFATGLQYARSGENLIGVARELVQQVPCQFWVIENVPDAAEHMRNPIQLCGSAFGMGVQKHRVFETSFEAQSTECCHRGRFEFCIGDRESPVTGYRLAHGLRENEHIRTKQVRECIPVQYVEEIWQQYQAVTNGVYCGRREGVFSECRLFS